MNQISLFLGSWQVIGQPVVDCSLIAVKDHKISLTADICCLVETDKGDAEAEAHFTFFVHTCVHTC